MRPKKCSDAEFIRLFKAYKPEEVKEKLGYKSVRAVYNRRERIESRLATPITSGGERTTRIAADHPEKLDLSIDDGCVFVGSDSHYWPDDISVAHRAFVKLGRKLKPRIVIKNGDELDGATISRHAKRGWEQPPSLMQEMECVRDRLCEIVKATPNARYVWCIGNHDMRYETRIANELPEYAKVHGVRLRDHFPEWRHCTLAEINENVVVKHRYRGGEYARQHNVVRAGRTICTGHLHRLAVTPFSDYNGTRYGIECGTMADPWGDQFGYLEMNPRNWQSGFAILSFSGGRHIDTELVRVTGPDEVVFRGAVLSV